MFSAGTSFSEFIHSRFYNPRALARLIPFKHSKSFLYGIKIYEEFNVPVFKYMSNFKWPKLMDGFKKYTDLSRWNFSGGRVCNI